MTETCEFPPFCKISTGWLIWYCFFLFGYFKHLELGCKVFLWLKFISRNGHLIICNVKVIQLEYMTRRNENVPKCQTWFFHLISKSLKIECKNYLPYSKSKACTNQITFYYQMSITWDGLDVKTIPCNFCSSGRKLELENNITKWVTL